MAASKLQANWTGVSHGATSITRIASVSFDNGGSNQSYSGDDNIYPIISVNLMNMPTASITTADIATVMGIASGTTATLTATHKDAKGASGGDINYTLLNAVAQSSTGSGSHAQFGTGTISFTSYSADGTTNPLSFTRS